MPLRREHANTSLEAVGHWLSTPNVNGLDIGFKTIGGEVTDALAILVYVTEKRRPHLLRGDEILIPKTVLVPTVSASGDVSEEAVPTDVIQRSPLQLAALTDKVRPTVGGYQISVLANWLLDEATGTLGVNMQFQGNLSILTNNHVISSNGNVGSNVYQPELALLSDDKVATVTGFSPVLTYANPNQPNPTRNDYDIAWATIPQNLAALNIKDIGQPTGIRAPVLNETVKWIGKTTGAVQTSTITSITNQARFEFSQGRWAFWKNVLYLPGGQVRQGDSGSAIVANSDKKIVGLIMANDPATLDGYGCRIPPH